MTQFIDSFPGLKQDEETKLADKQRSITTLLENISKAAVLPSEMSPDAHFSELQDDLDFKSRQLHNAETTQQRLELDLSKREGELEKIESLDTKISKELMQVEDKMRQYEKDIAGKYDNILVMKEQGESKCRQLEARKEVLEARVSALKQQIGFIKIGYEAKRQQLSDDKVAASVEAQEQQIKHYGANKYSLQTKKVEKEKETDFESEKFACLDWATQINKALQDAMMRPQ